MDSSSPVHAKRPFSEGRSGLAQRASLAIEDDANDFDIDQILYCSLATRPMNEVAIHGLAKTAARLNRLDHITGMLLYADGVFVQLIEGPREAVGHLWARLLRDPRHWGVVQLYHRREVEQRVCDGWDTRFVQIAEVRALVHEAMAEIVAGRKSAWAPAIARMDVLLSDANWDQFATDFKKSL